MQIQPHPTQQQITKARIAHIQALKSQEGVIFDIKLTRLQVLRMQVAKQNMDNISQFLSSSNLATSSTAKQRERKERAKNLHAINSL